MGEETLTIISHSKKLPWCSDGLMREMARRLNSTQYVLIGVLLGTCIYLWGRKFTVHLRGQTNGSIGPSEAVTNRPRQVCYLKLTA